MEAAEQFAASEPGCWLGLSRREFLQLELVLRDAEVTNATSVLGRAALLATQGHVRGLRVRPALPLIREDGEHPCSACTVMRPSPDGRPPCGLRPVLRLREPLAREVADTWLREHRSMVTTVVRSVVGWDRRSADDFVQAAHMGISRAVDTFDPDRGSNFRTYARAVIRNEAIRAARRERRHDEQLEPDDHFDRHPAALRSAPEHLALHETYGELDRLLKDEFNDQFGTDRVLEALDEGHRGVGMASGYSSRSIAAKFKRVASRGRKRGLDVALREANLHREDR